MYICICKAVTDKEIRKAAASGADSLYELQQALGVATGCGSCASDAQAILDAQNARRSGPVMYVPLPA